ncbi:uncharacterized protein cd4-2.2 isoform X3 [Oreochromis niloticus]|uniref:uncharacterized protein cd4-2.2 isoform X3 n=1 Tax=Oreochromis niloticus TaxID=8128 RepID=UPI000DF2C544|nr:uncharacterized protein LOC100708912 isoform X3 [Oreochromis niloticus]
MKVIVLFVFVLGALSAAGEEFFAKVGGKVTLNCGVSSYRRSLQWLHRYNLIHSVDQRGFTRKGTVELVQRSVLRRTNLEISSVTETDAGNFKCLADGTQHQHSLSVVSVFVSVHPSAVLKLNDEATLRCEVKGQPQGCEVKWKSPNTKSPTNPSTVQLKPVTNSHNGAWECIITCGSNTFSQSLTITVQEPTTTTTTTKSPSKPNGKSSNNDASPRLLGLAWWVWVAIGVGCLVAILLMVCVIVLCMRVRRRKKRFLKMKGQQRPRHKKYCQCDHPTAAAKPKQGRRREKPSALPLHPA